MRARLILGLLLLVGVCSAGLFASTGANKHWAAINFIDPVLVAGEIVMGPVLIVHDDEKMARGEACTTFYRFETGKGPREALVSFHCRPMQGDIVDRTTLTLSHDSALGCKRLRVFQIAGDAEAHGVPSK